MGSLLFCGSLCVLQRYSEAEKAMEQVLKLDPDCEEAVNDLFDCKALQLMVNTPSNKVPRRLYDRLVAVNEPQPPF